jgi:hypothetical protein
VAASSAILYHVVSLKFKPETTPQQIAKADSTFAALKDKIPGVTSLTWGNNVSPEGRAQGFTQCFVLTFASDAARDGYLTHPEHDALVGVLIPILADVIVLDFWGK